MKKLILFLGILFSVGMQATVYNGSCGTNLTWRLDTSDSTLVISGTGAMTAYPWSDYISFVKHLTIEEGVTTVCPGAFSNSPIEGTLVLPSTLTSIGSYAFNFCSMTGLVLPDGLTSIGTGAFAACRNLTGISTNTFAGCTGFTSLSLPESLLSIGAGAFNGCTGLTGNLTIPAGVTQIGAMALRNCTGIEQITMEPTAPPTIGGTTFSGIDRAIPIHVECGCKPAYQAAQYWSTFTNYQTTRYSITAVADDEAMGSVVISDNNE